MTPDGLLLAHGVGGRGDLPIPLWLFAYGAGGAVLVSFAALGVLWPASRLEHEVRGVALPSSAQRLAPAAAGVARVASLAFFLLVFAAAAFGENDVSDNLAPTAVYVVLWVGLQLVSAVVGDVWRFLSPFDTLALVGSWLRRRAPGRRRPGGDTEADDPGWGHWPAVAGLLGFMWLELVYVDPASPRVLAVAMAVYTAAMVAGAARWGRPWLRRGDAFAAWFGLLARMAPIHRDDAGILRLRPPLAGLPGMAVLPGTVALILVALGSTSFDGLARTRLWSDLLGGRTGWDAVPVATIGLLWTIGVVAAAYLGSMLLAARETGRDRDRMVAGFAHSLVPIALAYAVAHYFSLLVFEGQAAWSALSDPFGRGWDVFGAAGRPIDYGVLSTSAIAWVQAGAIVAGHVAGVLLAHDRAVAWLPAADARRSQYPLLAVMVAYTAGGLALLMGA